MNFSISEMNSTQRGANAVGTHAMGRFDPKLVCGGQFALIEGPWGRIGRLRRALVSVSGCEREVQSHHSLQVVGERMPQQNGARLAQAAHVEALQAAVAQMGVGALDAGGSLFVDLLGLIGVPMRSRH